MRLLNSILNFIISFCLFLLLSTLIIFNFIPLIQSKYEDLSLDNNMPYFKAIGKLVNSESVSRDIGYIGEEYDFDLLYYPYYGIIDSNYQVLYKQVYANALNLNSEFSPIIDIDKDDVSKIVEAVLYDHPELFWLDNSYTYQYNVDEKCLKIKLNFNATIEDIEKSRELFFYESEKIINEAKKYRSDLEKERFVHNYLKEILDYDTNSSLNQSTYSAIVNKSSVCAGYSKAFQYILMQLDIPCYYVTGYSFTDHAWNIVKLGSNYYNVDLTWDSTSDYTYEYFNKSDDQFSITHTRSELSSLLPSCN